MKSLILLLLVSAIGAAELPQAAQTALDTYTKDVAKAAEKLRAALEKSVTAETKGGRLDEALLVKAELMKLGSPAAEKTTDITVLLNGSFGFDFKNGHAGSFDVSDKKAVIGGISGDVRFIKNDALIAWANGTEWRIKVLDDGTLRANAPDGSGILAKR